MMAILRMGVFIDCSGSSNQTTVAKRGLLVFCRIDPLSYPKSQPGTPIPRLRGSCRARHAVPACPERCGEGANILGYVPATRPASLVAPPSWRHFLLSWESHVPTVAFGF